MSTRASLAELQDALDRNERISNDEWMASLSQRKVEELKFHDRDRDRQALTKIDSDTYERFYGNKKYYAATERSKQYVDEWIKHEVPGKVFLDYACGNGFQAIKAAKLGAKLSLGVDISRVSVENARADAQTAGVTGNSRFVQADAENTRLPDNSVDVVLCSGMLHHLDLSYAFPELRRILVPGGRILAVEALDYNPAIKLYRWKTPEMRTKWEAAHILSLKDLRFAKRFFTVKDKRFWHLTSIAAPHLRFIPARALDRVDSLLEKTPGVRLLAWMFTFVLEKKAD